MSQQSAPTLAHLRKTATQVGALLARRHLTLSVAESCSGGLLSSVLTDIPGSSQFLRGGIIAYSNFAKTSLLHIAQETLETHGAVSAETAQAMAYNIQQQLQTDIALALTGITGPGGGTPEKPVGLVYLHLIAPHADQGEMHIWPHQRLGNKYANVAAALHMILHYVKAKETTATPTPQQQQNTLIVEATWRNENWRPQALWLQGKRLQVIGVGRQQRTAQGLWIMTVELSNGDRAELEADANSGVWRLRRHWPARRYA